MPPSAAPPPLPLWGDECRRLLREALSSAPSASSQPPASRRPQEAAAPAGATAGGIAGTSGERAQQQQQQQQEEEEEEEEEENGEAPLEDEGELPSSSSSSSSRYSSSSSEDSDRDEDVVAAAGGPSPPPLLGPRASAAAAASGEAEAAAAASAPAGGGGGGEGTTRRHKTGRGRGGGGRGRPAARRYAGSVPCRQLPLPPPRCVVEGGGPPHGRADSSDLALFVPSCLWMPAKQRRRRGLRLGDRAAGGPPSADPPALWVARHADHEEPSDRDLAREILDLAERLSSPPLPPQPPLSAGGGPYVVVWWMRSGRFAGGVFLRERCVAHSTQARYTTRRGQGGAQGAHDSSGSKAKSAGARLRRAGEARLWEDARKVAVSWKPYFGASALVFAWAPPVMQGTLFEKAFAGVLDRDDPRIRTQLPVTAGRPTFESLAALYEAMTACAVRPVESARDAAGADAASSAATDAKAPPRDGRVGARAARDRSEERGAEADQVPSFPPLTALHRAAAAANVDELAALLEELRLSTREGSEGKSSGGDAAAGVNAAAGPLLQTPLHYAAAAVAAASAAAPGVAGAAAAAGGDSAANVAAAALPTEAQAHDAEAEGPSAGAKGAAADARAKAAAECVYRLLVDGGADPAVLDARRRVPYYLAGNDEVRAAFRRARAALGDENGRDWEAARVGPPLAEADEALRREREAERRRQKKQRQKERRAKDRAEAEAAALDLQNREDEARRQEEARRARDGLPPKDGSRWTNACDYCQRVCAGLRRRDMYQRLEYAYCSTDCVQKHKRELLASAALARFGGGGGGPSQQP